MLMKTASAKVLSPLLRFISEGKPGDNSSDVVYDIGLMKQYMGDLISTG
jgi:hypothetical protein